MLTLYKRGNICRRIARRPQILGQFENLFLEAKIAKSVPVLAADERQIIKIFRRGELDRLQSQFRRGAADDNGEVIGQAGGGSEGEDFFLKEIDETVMRQQRRVP